MLVLTQKISETTKPPSLSVSRTVKSVEGWRVRPAVSPPKEIPVHSQDVSARTKPLSPSNAGINAVRILVADADSSLAKIYTTHLSLLGFEVTMACNGVECLARLRNRIPHLIVLDAGLLWGRATDVLAILDECTDIPDVPVLVTYDHTCEQALPDVRSFRVNDYAAKPLTPNQLAERIRELIAFAGNCDEDLDSVDNCEGQSPKRTTGSAHDERRSN
ncbi:MAG: hypothetical protein CME32_30265 [Gimesia sp.]|nr:hypothetical protein [Gimesia sp.]